MEPRGSREFGWFLFIKKYTEIIFRLGSVLLGNLMVGRIMHYSIQPDNFDKTFAEMDGHEKNSISHRGLALKKLKEHLQQNEIL